MCDTLRFDLYFARPIYATMTSIWSVLCQTNICYHEVYYTSTLLALSWGCLCLCAIGSECIGLPVGGVYVWHSLIWAVLCPTNICNHDFDLNCTLPDQCMLPWGLLYVNPTGFKLRPFVSLCNWQWVYRPSSRGVCVTHFDLNCTLPDQYMQPWGWLYVNPTGFKLRPFVSLCNLQQPKGQCVYTSKVPLCGEGNKYQMAL